MLTLLIFNPTEKEVEIVFGGQHTIFKSKESKDVSEEFVKHATATTNSPLVIQTPMYDKEVEISDVNYSEMPWKKLVQMASARGVFKPPMKRAILEKLMEEYDKERGTL